jgi:hypothetical protein
VEPNVSTPPERRHTIAETLALVDHIRRIACDRSLDDRDTPATSATRSASMPERTSATAPDPHDTAARTLPWCGTQRPSVISTAH